MCGIAGVITGSGAQETLSQLDNMLRQIEHRGPDDFGIEAFSKSSSSIVGSNVKTEVHSQPENVADVFLGHRRLSIIDTSSAGHQPMNDASGSLTIVFNGEIYNYLELKNQIGDEYPWSTHSDTEVVLAAYRKWGTEMFAKFDGMFAISLYDREKQMVVFARDKMNIKPFYYHYSHAANLFLFASEPRPVANALNSELKFNSRFLAEFMVLAISDHDEGCMIDQVSQLRGGNYLELDLKSFKLSSKAFYKPSSEAYNPSEDDFSHRFKRSVELQLRADVQVGTSLSGGIDSSAIACTVGQLLKNDSSSYSALTFTFPNFPNDEAELAKMVASNSGINWQAVEPDLNSMPQDLETMIQNMGEPFGSLSMFAQYKVMEQANKMGIKVMLDGQGGDELYLGYPRMAQRVMIKYLKDGKLVKFAKEMIGLKENLSIPYWQSIAGNVYFNSKAIAYTRRFRAMSEFIDPSYLENANKEVIADFYSPKPIREKQEDELFKYILPRLLRYGDRNSMAFGVESRVPHLSNLMVDQALNLPLDQKVSGGWTKLILRKYLEGKVPNDITWNKVKKGFDVPQEFWITQLSSRMLEWVDGLSNDVPLNKEKLKATIKDSPSNHFLWPVMSVVALNQLSQIKF